MVIITLCYETDLSRHTPCSSYKARFLIGKIRERGIIMLSRRLAMTLVMALVLVLSATPGLAQQPQRQAQEKDQGQIVRGPAEVTFGQFLLALREGASCRVKYQPENNRLDVETLVGEAKILTSARNLVLIENIEGKIQVLLTSTGRVTVVEPGKSEIFGRAIVNDAGQIVVTVASKLGATVLFQPATFPAGDIPGSNLGYRPRIEGLPLSPTTR